MGLPFLLETAADPTIEELGEVLSELADLQPSQIFSRMKDALVGFWPTFMSALLVFLAGYVAITTLNIIIKRILKFSKVDESLHYFIRKCVKFGLYCVLLVTCLGVMGVPMTPLLTILGAAGLALSLSLQDSLGNIAGGISILLNRPFAKGDFVEIGEVSGTVQLIRLFYTVLNTVDNKLVHIPNGDVSKATIINYSAQPNRRLDITFPIPADSDVEEAKKIIRNVVRSSGMVLEDPAPIVRVSDHTFTLIHIVTLVWVERPDFFDAKSFLIQHGREKLREAGFSSRYPARDAGSVPQEQPKKDSKA